MDLGATVDIYCERLGPEFWAEPWNALSNLAFILPAFWAWRSTRIMGVHSMAIHILIALAFCISIGSFLFHTYAQVWSEFADTIAIWTFVAGYIVTSMHVMGAVRPSRIAVIALGVGVIIIVSTIAFDSPDAVPSEPSWSNGSEQYLPAVIAMLVLSGLALRRRHPMRMWFIAATATFLVSLGFRTLDMHVCAALPIGTHFIWHILNGAMIALLLQALIRSAACLEPKPSAR